MDENIGFDLFSEAKTLETKFVLPSNTDRVHRRSVANPHNSNVFFFRAKGQMIDQAGMYNTYGRALEAIHFRVLHKVCLSCYQ